MNVESFVSVFRIRYNGSNLSPDIRNWYFELKSTIEAFLNPGWSRQILKCSRFLQRTNSPPKECKYDKRWLACPSTSHNYTIQFVNTIVILACAIVCTRHNFCLRFVQNILYTLTSVNHIHSDDDCEEMVL